MTLSTVAEWMVTGVSPGLPLAAVWARKKYVTRNEILTQEREREFLTPLYRQPLEEPVVVLGPLAPVEIPPEVEDPLWMDVVGIPIDLWCSLATRCHGPSGFELGQDRIDYLVRRRELGDFRQPVDLVKRARRIKEIDPSLFRSLRGVNCPYCGSGSIVECLDSPERRYECRFCKGIFDPGFDPKKSDWAEVHQAHGIMWNRILRRTRDELQGTCLDCHEIWTWDFNTSRGSITGGRARPRNGVYHDMTEQEMETIKSNFSDQMRQSLMILPPLPPIPPIPPLPPLPPLRPIPSLEMIIDGFNGFDDPPRNPGLRRRQ